MSLSPAAVLTGRTAVLVRRTITLVIFVIAGLAFAFGFGNGLALGLDLGVPGWIAPLVAPAVDLSVLALIVAIQFVRSQGFTGRMVGPRLLLAFSGLVTIVLNTATAVLKHHYGLAAFDAVAPLLLIGWGEVGPSLLTLLHSSVPDEADEERGSEDEPSLVPDDSGPSPELVARARELATAHQKATGKPLSRDALRAELKVSNALAGELLRVVRREPSID